MISNKKRYIYIVLIMLAIVFCAYPIYSAFISGVFKWHLSQWVLWKDCIELVAYMSIIIFTSCFCKNRKGYFVLILFSVYLLSTGTFFQCFVSYAYIEILICIGESFLKLFDKKITCSTGVCFLTGSIVWGILAISLSIFKHGTINELRVMTVIVLLLAIINLVNKRQEKKKLLVLEYCDYLNKIDMIEFLINLFFVLVMMVSCARVNTYIESDSAWYALNTEKTLFGENSFFDFLGYTEFVYYYPKFKELLMAPITGLGLPGYLISSNLWIMYIPTRQSTLHGVLVHGFRRYSARFPVISA